MQSSIVVIVVVFTISAICYGRPQDKPQTTYAKTSDKEAIIEQSNSTSSDKDGKYAYSFETSNGLTRSEKGELGKIKDSNVPVLRVEGGYAYTQPDGKTFIVTYVADENGFQPRILDGSFIPTFEDGDRIGSALLGSLIGNNG